MEEQGLVRNHETTLRRKDGSPVHVLINAFAVRDAHGRTMQYRGLMLDISGVKSFQAELQRERDFSGKILNNTQSLILVADTAGLVSYANRRWQEMGYEQKQILGQPLENLVAAPRRHVLAEAYGRPSPVSRWTTWSCRSCAAMAGSGNFRSTSVRCGTSRTMSPALSWS